MKSVVVLVAASLLLLAACNPAARCATAADCSTGVCSGGFCTDVAAGGGAGGGGGSTDGGAEATDTDNPDAAGMTPADDGGTLDAGDNGRQ